MTLLRAACDGAVVGWGRWADVGARGCCGPWSRRRPRRFAPAALGDCGVRPAAAARCACCLRGLWGRAAAAALSRLLPGVTLRLGRIKGEWFSQEVNDLFWTLEASACFGRYFLWFCHVNPAVLYSKSVDASGLCFYSFTSRENHSTSFFVASVLGAMARALADIERKTASLGQSRACPGVSAGLSAQFAVLCCGVLKGAAGGHDDVCFAFGRNPACR